MKVQFLGAAQTVTGSCYAIEAAGHRFAVDCGMHQGNNAIEDRNLQTKLYRPESFDFILLTHAHIDHSGLLPRLVAEGFKGDVYCTAPTRDLATLMLEDSAHIQEMEFEWRSRQNKRRGEEALSEDSAPLYTVEDAKNAAKQMRGIEFDSPFEPASGIKVTYRYAGHILGAAFIDIEVTENGKTTRLTFSGDLGRDEALLVPNPANPTATDYLFVESTYGDRNHKGEGDTLKELAEAIAYSYGFREKVIIPSFAVERTQEILYSLILLSEQGKIPKDMPIYVDSPLAVRATDVFIKYAQELQTPETPRDITAIKDPAFNIHYTLNTAESQALNTLKGPAIIISASGMCNAGRIKHHLKHNIWKKGVSVVFVGYQAIGTLGRKIVEGAKDVKIFSEELNVAAKIFTIGGFSAHAGLDDLMEWVGEAAKAGSPHVIVVHGEIKAQENFAALIREKYHLTVSIPEYLEEMTLEPGQAPSVQKIAEPAKRAVDWNFIMQDMDMRIQQLRDRLAEIEKRPWEEQVELRDDLAEINRQIYIMLTNLK